MPDRALTVVRKRRSSSICLAVLLLAAACSDPEPTVDLEAQDTSEVGTIPTDTSDTTPVPTATPAEDEATDTSSAAEVVTDPTEAAEESPEPEDVDPADATDAPADVPTSEPNDETDAPIDAPVDPTPTAEPAATATPTPAPAEPTEIPAPTRPEDLDLVLTPLVSLAPLTAMASRPGSESVFVTEKTGRVLELVVEGDSASIATTVLDLRGSVSGANEQGLLGLAFSPDGATLVVNFTDLGGTTQVVRYAMAGGVADPATATPILSVAQPAANHNGGDLAFGPDGHLYVALGDGGGANDVFGHGQNIDSLLGTIARIDLDGGAPADNPLVGADGDDRIWLYGVRNPWRISFDRATGDLWVADVGQGTFEEITVLYASIGAGRGANLGWPFVEGTAPFAQSGPPAGGNYAGPIFQYGRDNGCSITGGYVYRGPVAALDGVYVFGDFCTSQVWGIVTSEAGGYDRFVNFGLSTGPSTLAAFGQGPDGSLYVVSLAGTLFRIDAR